MANHKSAEKRHRQSLKRRANNRFARSTFRTTIRSSEQAAKEGDFEKAETLAQRAMKLIDKAAAHKVLHKNTAARQISRLHKRLGTLKSAAAS